MPRPRILLPLLLALLIAAVAAPSALAATRYVDVAGNDQGGANTCTDAAAPCLTVKEALAKSAIDPDPDTVQIGTGTFSGTAAYSGAGPVTVVGAGRAATTLTQPNPQPATYGQVLALNAPGSSVSDLTVAVVNQGARGLGLTKGAVARRVDVTGDATATNAVGVLLGDGSFVDGSVSLPATGGVAVTMNGVGTGSAGVAGSRLVAGEGVYSNVDDNFAADVTKSRITAVGGVVARRGTVNVEQSLIQVQPGPNAAGLLAEALTGDPGTRSVVADHVTVAGSGTSGAGAYALSLDANQVAAVTVTNSVLTGVSNSLLRYASGSGDANVSASYDGYTAPTSSSPSGAGSLTASHIVAAAPGLASDFRLSHDSALIDAGDPAGGGAATDLGGGPRVVDGNGDGSALSDIGAFEYQRAAPAITAAADAADAPAGMPIGFSATTSDPDGDDVTVTWAFDDGTSASGPSVSHAFATGGSHTATATATDASGRNAQATVTVQVAGSPGGPGGPGTGGGPVGGTTPAAKPKVTIAKAAKVAKGRIAVRVTCVAIAGRCSGKLTLRTGKRSIGSKRFAIPARGTRTVVIKPSRRAATTLRKHHWRGNVRASASVKAGKSTVRTVKLAPGR